MQKEVHPYYFSVHKRAFDVLLALVALIIFSPMWLIISFLLIFTQGFPLFFKQKRIGRNKEPFTIYKFRTMFTHAKEWHNLLQPYNESVPPMFKMKNDPRFTPIGKILSHSGFDEIPQIINILKNEMSFIGPRPLPESESSQLDGSWNYRYAVKPGIFSKWALSNKKHTSKKLWQRLEKETIQDIHSPFQDFSLMMLYLFNVLKTTFFKNS